MRKWVWMALAGGVSFSGAPAMAATVGGSLSVQITLTSTCTVSATTLNFGNSVALLTSVVNAQATITVTCSEGTDYIVGLDAGANESTADNVNTRRMTDGDSNYVGYQLYQDSDREDVWGTATVVGATTPGGGVGGTGTGAAVGIPVYGQVPVQNTPPAGTYSDTVAILVTY